MARASPAETVCVQPEPDPSVKSKNAAVRKNLKTSAAARTTPGVPALERPGEECAALERHLARVRRAHVRDIRLVVRDAEHAEPGGVQPREDAVREIGRASCRERG